MTVAVGYIEDHTVYIGVDSYLDVGYQRLHDLGKKIITIGDMIIAGAGWTATLSLIKAHENQLPNVTNLAGREQNESKFLTREFLPKVRQICKESEFSEIEKGSFSINTELLIGWRGKLFTVYGNFAIANKTDLNYAAIGVGGPYALGSMFAVNNEPSRVLAPKDRVLLALVAAGEHCSSVRQPFIIKAVKTGSKEIITL